MQQKRLLLLTFLMSLTQQTLASSFGIKVIYGDDNRLDVFESRNALYIDLAQSTAAMIANEKLVSANTYEYKVMGQKLSQRGICASERFAEQPTAANCSGFLVTADTLVTAGHCIVGPYDCSSSSWVFDFKVDRSDQEEVMVNKSNVYKCSKIISRNLDGEGQNDYAYIKLDRKVTDRKPLKYRTSGKPQVGDQLVVIGHPSGLPTKIADGAAVRSVNNVYLVANLDTYGGNSGSAVFNSRTGLVEGILVRGDTDYIYDSSRGCQVSNRLPNNGGRGEDVTLINNIKELPGISDTPPKDPPGKPRVRRSWWRRIFG